MALTIGSNIESQKAQRQLARVSTDLSFTYERLASGQRITRASDDAAGLAISESLKNKGRISSQAIRNVSDGISVISIISGALDSQKTILLRMAELAEQAANGTNSQKQRDSLQKEYGSLLEEFDRVASTTEFNGVSLLRNPNAEKIQIMAGITGSDPSLLEVTAANSHQYAGVVGYRIDPTNDGVVNSTDLSRMNSLSTLSAAGMAQFDTQGTYQDYAVKTVTDSQGNTGTVRFLLSPVIQQQNAFAIPGIGVFYANGGPVPVHTTQNLFISGTRSDGDTFGSSSTVVSVSATSLAANFNYTTSGATVNLSVDLSGTTYDCYDWASVNGEDRAVRPTAIGFTNIESIPAARRALDTVRNRTDDLSALQSTYGAVESRLRVASNQLSVSKENFAAAASRIADVDVAFESSQLVAKQILQKSAVSILGQANVQPQIALQLLRS